MKKGYQSPKGGNINSFSNITLRGHWGVCKEHRFIFDKIEEERKLYNAEPCVYTDSRYWNDSPFYGEAVFHGPNGKRISLKSCMRLIESYRNIPKGSTIVFGSPYHIRGKNVSLDYLYKVKKEATFNPEYRIDRPSYFKSFTKDSKSNELVEALRSNGFLVRVFNDDWGIETAIAYGHNTIVGFSQFNDPLMGYNMGKDHILFDYFGEFNKWSQCNIISKRKLASKIVSILLDK